MLFAASERPTHAENYNPLGIFDSAATTHMVNDKKLLENVKQVPEVAVTTAVQGAKGVIRERGELILNEKYALSDVAYMQNASANLISEGRLLDGEAGKQREIIKSAEYLILRNTTTKEVILRGARCNRLWICSLGGKLKKTFPQRPRNTLLSQNKRRRQTSPNNRSSSSSSSASNQPPSPPGTQQVQGED